MNLFVIHAPYQIINAMEAIHFFHFKDNMFIIPLLGLFSKQSLKKMVDKTPWQSVKYINFYHRFTNYDFGATQPRNLYERSLEVYLTFDQILKKMQINRLAGSLGPVDNLILGNYLNDYDLHMRHLANRIQFNHLYLLDVGTDTLRINRQRNHENTIQPKYQIREHNPCHSFKSRLRKALLDWNAAGAESLTFFSSYDFEVTSKDRLIKNEYRYLRSLANNSIISDEVWFIAQPLVEQEYLSMEVFLQCLLEVKAYFPDNKLVYIAHPRESHASINALSKIPGLEIRKFDVPVEYEVAAGGKRPKCIASFFSSALENCAIIFGDNMDIKAFQIRDEYLMKDVNIINKIYYQYSVGKNGIIDVVPMS